MSEAAPEATQDGNNSGATSAADEFKPITSQDDLNRIIGDRVKRAEAKFADYGDLKAKADQLDQLTEASQTEAEKAAKRASKAESERDSARAEAMRLRIAVEHGISLEDADLFLTGTDETSLRAQAERLSAREAARKTAGNRVATEGGNPNPKSTSDLNAFVGQLFGDT